MIKFVMGGDGVLKVVDGTPEPSAAERAERKRAIARCGHVKRRLVRNEPLRGKLLNFAIGVVGEGEIADKLRAGQPLSEYELHLVVDVYLLHVRLGSRPSPS